MFYMNQNKNHKQTLYSLSAQYGLQMGFNIFFTTLGIFITLQFKMLVMLT